jgi:hypothetical protein
MKKINWWRDFWCRIGFHKWNIYKHIDGKFVTIRCDYCHKKRIELIEDIEK